MFFDCVSGFFDCNGDRLLLLVLSDVALYFFGVRLTVVCAQTLSFALYFY
jgi:hypothetical protein